MKIPELSSRAVWAVLLVIFIVTSIIPMGAPFVISEYTLEAYNLFEELPEGSIVVMGGAYVFAFDLESSAGMIATLKQMARLGHKLVCAPLAVEAVQYEKYCIDMARVDEKYGGPWKYGVDYVILPYIPGGDAALVSFLEDVKATVSVDVAGTPLSELPLMDEFNNWEDIDVWALPHYGVTSIARFVVGERGIPMIHHAQAASFAGDINYMAIYPGLVFATNGFLGGAQYERLEGIKGIGHAAVDGYYLVSAALIGFIILGNATMLTETEEEEIPV